MPAPLRLVTRAGPSQGLMTPPQPGPVTVTPRQTSGQCEICKIVTIVTLDVQVKPWWLDLLVPNALWYPNLVELNVRIGRKDGQTKPTKTYSLKPLNRFLEFLDRFENHEHEFWIFQIVSSKICKDSWKSWLGFKYWEEGHLSLFKYWFHFISSSCLNFNREKLELMLNLCNC